jgi:hypothetical protein
MTLGNMRELGRAQWTQKAARDWPSGPLSGTAGLNPVPFLLNNALLPVMFRAAGWAITATKKRKPSLRATAARASPLENEERMPNAGRVLA